jgi:cyclic beta-1,2-glucan synthetase
VNVLANDDFGTLVSEAGGGFSWSINSGENRLTQWTNDPVADRPAETLYLRDEEDAAIWTVTPSPTGMEATCQVRHGAGYSEWRQHSHGLEQRMRVLVPTDAPVKLVKLMLHNPGARHRRITATYYAEWLLGSLPGMARRHVHCDFDEVAQAILASNPWNAEFGDRVAFLTASQSSHGFTTDRQEFLGREGGSALPAGLLRWGLSGRLTAGEDACGAYQIHIDLPPGASAEVVFALGQGANRTEASALAAHWRAASAFDSAEAAIASHWDELLGSVEVRTPDPAFDLMLNRWLLYQSLSSRILGRTGFYQASGAYGFRDQLQDVLAFLIADPARVRAHILRCAAHQFEEGDVMHWWHPPSSRGVRTRCSDDLLWLPYAVGTYVEATGDLGILEEEVPFRQAPPLSEHEADRYASFETGPPAALIEHCDRAMEHMALGAHGLPLIGGGDWNDGMDRVGHEGRGESVWLAWFAAVTADLLADLHERLGRPSNAYRWRDRAAELRAAAENAGWDGGWYRRAYDDDGRSLGSISDKECRIDSISQSWAVFAGADPERIAAALGAAGEELIDPDAGLVRLLWPPFDRTLRDPGYIKAYPPGVRENGGQYAHAAAWLGLAYAKAAQGDNAKRVFDMLNPIRRADNEEAAAHYRLEPYAIAGDVCTVGPLRGQGGWSWYTGAAAWTQRLGVEGILGLTLRDGRLHVDPCLPKDWGVCEATIRRDGAAIELRIEDPANVGHSAEVDITVDGGMHEGRDIAFPASGAVRRVTVRVIAKPTSA